MGTAVQSVWSWRNGSRKIEHLGSAHDDAGIAALKSAGAQRLVALGGGDFDVVNVAPRSFDGR